jgi:uncharacterized membrane protein
MKTFLYNLVKVRGWFLANTIHLSLISIFIAEQESPTFYKTLLMIGFNLSVYIFLYIKSKQYILRRRN